MYRTLTASDFKKHLTLREDYRVDGFLVYGTWSRQPYDTLKKQLSSLGGKVTFGAELPNFLAPILEFQVESKTFWFVTAYGGALLSEYVHLACLLGSKQNIVLGSCGGLAAEANARDIIMPTYSYGDESTTRAYANGNTNMHHVHEPLAQRLVELLEDKHKIWRAPTITFQAMLGETWKDVTRWSKAGYSGVEMEVATVVAVSNHFNIPSAAVLMVADNLIKEETVVDDGYGQGKRARQVVIEDMFAAALEVLIS